MASKSILIVSSGRTGTTYIQKVLSSFQLNVHQEPGLSRLIYLLSNLADSHPSSAWSYRVERLAVRLYQMDLRKRYERVPDTPYVEINPFISNILPQFAQSGGFRYDALVHIVREPSSWVKSMMQFGAYSWRRPIIRWIPFAYYKEKSLKSWSTLSFAKKLSHEWAHRNNAINESKAFFPVHFTVKYEDIFCKNQLNFMPLMPIIDYLGIAAADVESSLIYEHTNSSSSNQKYVRLTQNDREYIHMLTSNIAERLGYDLAAK